MESLPLIQIRNSSLIFYSTFPLEVRHKKRNANLYQWKPESNKTYSGEVKKGTQKRIRQAVDLLLQCCEPRTIYNPIIQKSVTHRLSFITLTLSNNDRFISGKEAYKNLLKPFLQWLYKTEKVNTYIWKAERQKATTKNGELKGSLGQLHYHITTPAFILYDKLKDKWNYLQKKSGYLESYKEKYGNYNPNSTDIHAVYNIKDIESYLIKYISKEPYTHYKVENEILPLPTNKKGNTYIPKDLPANASLVVAININDQLTEIPVSIDGKVWDCSTNIKGKKYFTVEEESYNGKKVLEYANKGLATEIPNEHCGIIKLQNLKGSSVLAPHQLENYSYYINQIKSSINYIDPVKDSS